MGSSGNLLAFTDSNFAQEVLQSDIPVMVDFTAVWCGPCKQLAPIVERLADELAGRVKVGKLDIDDSPNAPVQYGIRSVPTVMIFQGGKPVGQHVGLTNRERLLRLLALPESSLRIVRND